MSQPTLLRLAAPLVVSFTLRSALTSIDIPYTAWVAEPDAALAAMALFFPLDFAFIACWIGCSSALTSHLGRAMGERSDARLGQLMRTAALELALLALVFLALSAAAWFAAPLLTDDPRVARAFRQFAPVVLAGNAVFGLWSVLPDSLVKAHHDTRTTMIAGLWTAGLNVLLNTLFVPLLRWGVPGIALATTCARLGGLVYALLAVRRLERARREAWSQDPPARPAATTPGTDPATGLLLRPHRALLALAVPSSMTYTLFVVETSFVNGMLQRFPDATSATAAYTLYQRGSTLLYMPIIALSTAVLPFVARRIGEGRRDEVRASLREAFVVAYAYAILLAAPVCVALGGWLAWKLGRAESTRELAAGALRFATPLGLLAAVPFSLARPTFEALQRPLPGLALAALRYVALAIPLGLAGAALAESIGRHPFHGLVAGLVLGSAITSTLALAWVRATLQRT